MWCTFPVALYPLEQLLVGFVCGAILSWCGASIYFTGDFNPLSHKNRDEDDDAGHNTEGEDDLEDNEENRITNPPSDEPPVITVIAPTLPNKSIVVLHLTDENLRVVKDLIETITSSIQTKPEISLEPSPMNELDAMFEELSAVPATPPPPHSQLPSSPPLRQEVVDTPGGGYRTIRQLNDMCLSQKAVPEGSLSRPEELVIIGSFRSIIGMSYADAQAKVAEQNFTLHPLYVSMGSKMPLSKYSNTTIGVRISDSNFDTTNMKPSPDARVTELIDVGGIDARDIGIIKL
jgi:hypothetical protein